MVSIVHIYIAGLKFKDVKKEVTLFAFINILQFNLQKNSNKTDVT